MDPGSVFNVSGVGPPPSSNLTKVGSNVCAAKIFVCAAFILKILIK